MSIRRVLGLVAVFALVVSACSSAATPTPPAAAPPAASSGGGQGAAGAVTIADFSFSPATLTVAAGTTVTWTNNDSTAHTVTLDDGSVTSGDIAAGATYQHTFATAGTFAYHCKIHPTMKATITVTP